MKDEIWEMLSKNKGICTDTIYKWIGISIVLASVGLLLNWYIEDKIISTFINLFCVGVFIALIVVRNAHTIIPTNTYFIRKGDLCARQMPYQMIVKNSICEKYHIFHPQSFMINNWVGGVAGLGSVFHYQLKLKFADDIRENLNPIMRLLKEGKDRNYQSVFAEHIQAIIRAYFRSTCENLQSDFDEFCKNEINPEIRKFGLQVVLSAEDLTVQ